MSVNEKMTAIADAIREKTGGTEKLTLDDMPEQIGGIKAEPVWASCITGGSYLFHKAKFPENAEVTIEFHQHINGLDWFMREAENVKKLTIIYENRNAIASIPASSLCSTIASLEVVDLSRFNCIFHNLTSAFSICPNLKEIIGVIDFSLCTHLTNTFTQDYSLEKLSAVAGSIKSTFYINSSPKLSAETIQSIIDGLADLTGQTAQTITFHKEVGAKLTDAQKVTITAKNWTLVY